MSEPIRLSPKLLHIEHEGTTRGRWYVRVPAEHTIEDVLKPEYFGQCVAVPKMLRVPDVIEVEPEDLSWALNLTVLAVSPQTRRVITRVKGDVQAFDVTLAPEQIEAGYKLKFIGREAGWGVFMKDDVRAQGFKTAAAALEKLDEIAPVKAKKAA